MMDYAQIEDYLQGKLEGDELKQFEQRLGSDSSFAEAVQLYRNMHNEIWGDEGEQLLRQRARQLEQKHFKPAETARVIPFRRARWYWAVAAAAIVVAAIFIIPLLTAPAKTPNQLFAELTTRDSLSATTRGGEDPLKPAIARAYNAGKYAEALPLLEQYTKDHPGDAAYNFAKAACYTETGNYPEAVRGFDTLINGTSIYKYKAVAMKALITFRQGRKEEAARILDAIPPDARIYEKARELIRELK